MLNVKIKNNTSIISHQVIIECLNLLPNEYRDLENIINIFKYIAFKILS